MCRLHEINRYLVTAGQMQAIEHSVFAAGMPVAALMEKVGGLLFCCINRDFSEAQTIGLLVGPGHNGGDALVVGRELHLMGKRVKVWMPGERQKKLTVVHSNYLRSLNAEWITDITQLNDCDLLIDGLFGFGLGRSLEGIWRDGVEWANRSGITIASIDVPSGIHTDTGETLGIAIQAHKTYCLGLWKRGLFQDRALAAVGDAELIDFGLPLAAITQEMGDLPNWERLSAEWVHDHLPANRWGQKGKPANPNSHKYTHGHLLLVAGSARYSGAAILAALGARPSGLGMLTVAVPESLGMLLRQMVPEALIIPCPETESGAIAQLPDLRIGRYSAIALGPGMDHDIEPLVAEVCEADVPLVIDADGLNALARLNLQPLLNRDHPTVLTPHVGEFRRLFPDLEVSDRWQAVQTAAKQISSTILLKGARTIISNGDRGWVNPESTSALARGGSGDVLLGLLGGLLAQGIAADEAAGMSCWWHAQAAMKLVREQGMGGVDPMHLAGALGGVAAYPPFV